MRIVLALSLLVLADCERASTRAYERSTAGDASLVVAESSRDVLAAEDVGEWRCVLRIDGAFDGEFLGASVCSIADQDGDGRADFALGACDATRFSCLRIAGRRAAANDGLVVIVSSHGRQLGFAESDDARTSFGADLRALSDVDGDGVNDWAMSATSGGRLGLAPESAGAGLRLISGANARLLRTLPATAADRSRYHEFERVEDVDGDGREDLLFDIWDPGEGPTLTLCSSRTGRVVRALKLRGVSRFLAVEDLDRDGVQDFAVIEHFDAQAALDEANPRARLAIRSGEDGSEIATPSSELQSLSVHIELLRVSDLDGDGVRELLVNVVTPGDEERRRESIACVSPRTGRLLFERAVEEEGLVSAQDLVVLDDLDGDGRADLAANAFRKVGTDSRDCVVLLALRPDGWRELAQLPGSRVFALGDRDGDGRVEFATTDATSPEPSAARGRVWVWSRSGG